MPLFKKLKTVFFLHFFFPGLVVLRLAFLTAFLAFVEISNAAEPQQFNLGLEASEDEIAAWDIDVKPNGAGLPAGSGDAANGATLYKQKCEHCHGPGGVGGPFGSLVGRLANDSFPFGRDASIEKTVGNYWPYATTLFDYINRAMPFEAPGSLSNNEVYSLVAYVLEQNKIIAAGTVVDQQNLAGIKMPARDRFVPDNRRGGNEVR